MWEELTRTVIILEHLNHKMLCWLPIFTSEMIRYKIFLFGLFILPAVIWSCKTGYIPKDGNIGRESKLHFLGEYIIPHNQQFKNTTLGGLSGIDYDKEKDVYYLISDDWSQINPARFYTAKISVTGKGIDSVVFLDVKTLLRPDGSTYPGSKQDPYHTADPEAIRYNPLQKKICLD